MGRQQGSKQQAHGWGCRVLLLAVAFLLIACDASEATPTPPSATGFTVLPQFRDFYDAHGGAALFGEPITGGCETADGRLVQYFQRMRLDYDRNMQQVNAYPLGQWALSGMRKRVPAPVAPSTNQRTFPATGYTVQDEFLTYYQSNGGETVLGPPISPQLDEGELRVQYFQNGRLEWHPTAPRTLRVQLGMLGQAHFAQGGADSLICDPRARIVEIPDGMEVNVDATLGAPVLHSGETQRVFVTITTSGGVPVPDVPVNLTVLYRGETFTIPLGRTDVEGRIIGEMDLPNFEPGHQVSVTVTAHTGSGGIIGTSALSFRTWW